jgi:hypothetical protein
MRSPRCSFSALRLPSSTTRPALDSSRGFQMSGSWGGSRPSKTCAAAVVAADAANHVVDDRKEWVVDENVGCGLACDVRATAAASTFHSRALGSRRGAAENAAVASAPPRA